MSNEIPIFFLQYYLECLFVHLDHIPQPCIKRFLRKNPTFCMPEVNALLPLYSALP